MRENVLRKITRPFRFVRYFWRNPKDASYDLARYFFRNLPVSLRNKLMTPASWIVRKIKRNIAPKIVDFPKDVSWEEFQNNVLLNKEQFKGIFIQEVIIDWGVPLYQRPQHLATSLGRLGYLVIYRTLNNLTDQVNGFREVAKNVWLTNCEQVNQIAGAVHSLYSTSFYIDFRSLHQNIHSERFLVYEYIDHIDPMISGGSENIKRILAMKEFAFNGGVDFIVASSRKLEAEAIAAVGKDKVLYLPNGVDVDHYRGIVHDTTPVSVDLTEFRKNHSHIIGYFGAIAPWLWYDAINELAHSRPDLGFVFIGPDYHYCVQRLPGIKNVLYLGTIDYKILPAYARHFDVCFIPFAPGEIAHTTSPLKLFEYFALEKPVVTTSFMDECVAFPEVFHGDSSESLSDAIDRATAIKNDPIYKSRLAHLSSQNSWMERAKDFESVFFKLEEFPIRKIQNIISRSYSNDGNSDSYYDLAYKFQEIYYWMPISNWILQLEKIRSVIDIGSAYGTLLLYAGLNHKVASMVAIDPVDYMSLSLKNKFNILSYKVDVERQDVSGPGKFDLVIFTEVIEHLNFHPLPTLLKIKELMHDDSYLVLSTPDADDWGRITKYYKTVDQMPYFSGQDQAWIDEHIYQYTRDEIDALIMKAGFHIEKFSRAPGVHRQHLCYLLSVNKTDE